MLVLTTLQKHLPAFDPRMASSKSGHPESNQGPSDLCKLYSQMLYQLSYSRLDTNHRIPQHTLNMLPDAQIYWHLPTRKKPVTLLCVSSLRGHGNLEKKAVTLLCVSSLRGHGNLARRIKLTRVTKENLRLKILEVKGASCVGDPAIVLGGPHLASPAPNKPVAKAIMLTSWQHHMDSVAERSKAVAQGAIP